ncbi:MAG: tannase/feruloyl esterase family alpha/beta hydrolase [Vicinamibacterales bacterium]|jgi:feruloyl esterase|nr:hypothetical protein [Acidobacteriota bacterium]MDP7295500.1 tannase/feruloyl esterase family alpha/beta hydrolase [Vicinamibacterales bacterium]MDP7473313.1 tannase/feruloyl esterase family alpha/beta hydrolase [Vicinamibacterales bacterium]MDP7672789.1 tannase/feruloyl esterase family alpha/beta hydrolase [Vicinamibacterales bacterium]HJO39785.1 tannase/feruloyl esterase family alpha/beta hydrolase [Vicinamibacterales bacterium]|tara:strand:- start:2589 stop:2837 length:249 start_codon:yes stop_codon:yes gene_type:complete
MRSTSVLVLVIVGATIIPWFETLVAWVERGEAPGELIGERVEDGEVVRTRRVCAYPEMAVYDGSGPEGSAESFVCAAAPDVR